MKHKSLIILLIFGLMLINSLASFPSPTKNVKLSPSNITLYYRIPAMVELNGSFNIERGMNIIRSEIPKDVDRDSIYFSSSSGKIDSFSILSGPNSEKEILEYMKGKTIEIKTAGNSGFVTITGKLLKILNGYPLIEKPDGTIRLVKNPVQYSFPNFSKDELPDMLEVRIDSSMEEKANLTMVYQQNNLSWKPVYKGIFNEKESLLDIKADAYISNRTDSSYQGTYLTLVAGEPEYEGNRLFLARAESSKSVEPDLPSGGKLFEFHTFDFSRPIDLPSGQIKALSFAEAENIPVKKSYIYRRAESEAVNTWLSFKNTEESGLGAPLPTGLLKLYSDRKGLKFIGEQIIPNTPEGETVSLSIGKAFDILAESKTIRHEKIDDKSWIDKVEIKITNRKEEKVTVVVEEKLKGSWKIIDYSQDYKKIDAQTIEFEIDVPADNSVRITYTYQYQY